LHHGSGDSAVGEEVIERRMRILVINPNTTQPMTDEIGKVARAAASPGTQIECVSPASGPRSIEGFADEVLASYHTLDLVAQTNAEYDGYVIACYGDPALGACREVTDVPVVGIAEASFHMAGLVAHKWSIVTVLPRVKPLLEELVARNGMEEKCASIRCTPLTVLEIEEDIERTKRMMVDEARSAIEEDDAEAILLGCAGLGPIDKTMQDALGIPVLDGTACAVKLLEGLHHYGIKTAKVKAYLSPEPKELVGCPASFAAVYDRERVMAGA
jgi:allantoin racemase